MKKAKLKETEQKNSKKNIKEEQETVSVKKVVITLAVILVTFGAFYLLTDYLVSKRTKTVEEESNTNTTTNTNEISFLDLLSKSGEYYVFALTDSKNGDIYKRYAGFNKMTYYIVNMNDPMNKTYLGDKTSIKDSVKDITIKEETLFVVKDGKIKEHQSGYDNIVKYLQKNISSDLNISTGLNK